MKIDFLSAANAWDSKHVMCMVR